MQVLITVKIDILNKLIIENWTDLVSHLYCIVLDIRKFNPVSRKYSKSTRVDNFYDNIIGNGYVWQRSSSKIR